jgi:hypothetical protein
MVGMETRVNTRRTPNISMACISVRPSLDCAQAKDLCTLSTLSTSALNNSAELVVIKRAEVDGLRSDSIVLERDNERQGLIQPVFFHRYDEVGTRAKLLTLGR